MVRTRLWTESQQSARSREADDGSHQSPPPHREADPRRSLLSHPCFPVPSPFTNSQDPCRGREDQTKARGTKGRGFLGASGIHSPERVLAGTIPRPSLPGHKAGAGQPRGKD